MIKEEVKLTKPIYLGMTILDYSKEHMYNFFYNVMKPVYGNGVSLLYTDTDSLILNVETDNLLHDFKSKLSSHLNLSNYDSKSEIYDDKNKKSL